ncbi:MAG: alpha/beta hydrolase [Opitutaceae bacterium]|jgi:acetyl esterase/lipase
MKPFTFLPGFGTTALLASLLLALSLHAQDNPLLLPLWQGQPPGSIASSSYVETVENRANDPISPRILKVSIPTIEVYLPAANQAKGSAVVICPGGGYVILAYGHEGRDIAKWFQERGVAAIILKYRLPSDEIMKDKTVGPLQDVQEAIRTVRRHAKDWGIDPGKIGVMGFSAGGHLAATASTLYAESVYPVADGTSARPDFSILVYPVISFQLDVTHVGSVNRLLGPSPAKALIDKFSNELQVNAQTPPAFLLHAQDDTVVPIANSISYYQAMKRYGVPGELHIYEKGGHGFGLKGPCSHWTADLTAWMKSRGLL